MTFLEALRELTEKRCVSISPKEARHLYYYINSEGILAFRSCWGVRFEAKLFLEEWEINVD